MYRDRTSRFPHAGHFDSSTMTPTSRRWPPRDLEELRGVGGPRRLRLSILAKFPRIASDSVQTGKSDRLYPSRRKPKGASRTHPRGTRPDRIDAHSRIDRSTPFVLQIHGAQASQVPSKAREK